MIFLIANDEKNQIGNVDIFKHIIRPICRRLLIA